MTDAVSPASTDSELVTGGRRAWSALEAVHVPSYFSPESREELKALGLRPSLAYFPVRAAAMGAVPAEVVEATFYVFAPALVRHVVPACWDVASPEQVLAARHRGVERTLHRLLAPVAAEAPHELDEAVALARDACAGLRTAGHPLYAGHAALPWPDDPFGQLWLAATLLREHRGDGHVAALVTHDLGPIEAMVTSLLAGSVVTEQFLRRSRGWTDDEWLAATQRLRDRGLVTDAGGSLQLTADGAALRRSVEAATDAGTLCAWEHLGLDRTRRLGVLVRPLRRAVEASGVLDVTRATS
ncbi:MAG: SCO6745 family protein [Angustibacter sp.]